jgi:hypothetical protein
MPLPSQPRSKVLKASLSCPHRNEYVLNQRLGWYGYVPGAKPSFYHSWYLQPEGTMCHVVMDEAGVGKEAAGLRKSDETLMHRGHDLWLATLKWVAEAK